MPKLVNPYTFASFGLTPYTSKVWEGTCMTAVKFSL